MKEYLKNNILLILITIILLCNLTVGILQTIVLYDIKDLTGIPYRIESLLSDMHNDNKSLLWDIRDILSRRL